jgi:hypothetical protein
LDLELEMSEVFCLEVLELDVLAGFEYRMVQTIELERSYGSGESLDQVSKGVDQLLARDCPFLAIGSLSLGSDSLPRTQPHLHHPSIPDVLSSFRPKGDLD